MPARRRPRWTQLTLFVRNSAPTSAKAPKSDSRAAPVSGVRRAENRVLRYFLRGVIIVVPVTVTLALVCWLFARVDGIFHPYIQSTGPGALLVISLIFGVGWISFFPAAKFVFGQVDA